MSNTKENLRLQELAHKWLKGTLDQAEQGEFDEWFKSVSDEPLEVPAFVAANEQEHEAALYYKILGKIGERQKREKILRWPRIAAVSLAWKVAAAVAVITLGTWLYRSAVILNSVQDPNAIATTNDIAPGKQGATITLASGKVIQLSDAKSGVVISDELTYSDGTTIPSSLRDEATRAFGESSAANQSHHAMLTANTAKGQTYQITLPDGTKVWLNADSKISFPSQFIGKERRIILEGEAYFAVVHNRRQPFVVESKGQIVEDIGTEFNIAAYGDEATIRTTLVEGAAAVNGTHLQPNQQAVLDAGGKIKVGSVDAVAEVAWKNGDFILDNDDFRTVMRMLARWYNIEVVYSADAPYDLQLYGVVSRSKNISAVLSVMEGTGKVKFRVEGKRVYVSK